jgi:hypothetical protein
MRAAVEGVNDLPGGSNAVDHTARVDGAADKVPDAVSYAVDRASLVSVA